MKKILLLFLAFGHLCLCGFAIEEKGTKTQAQAIPWGSYMSRVEKEIKANWKPPKVDVPSQTVVLFKVSKDGSLKNIKIIQSDGNEEAQKAALFAVEKSAPFDSLPDAYDGEDIDIDFTFDYNVAGKKFYPGSSETACLKDIERSNEFAFYTRPIEQEIIKNWNPPKRKTSYDIVAKCKINRDGSLSSAQIAKSSNEKLIDATYLEAIKQAAPFAPLPIEYKEGTMSVDFSVSYRTNQCFALTKVIRGKTYKDTVQKLADKKAKKEYEDFVKFVEKNLKMIALDEYSPAKSVAMSFDVTKDGNVENIKIIQSSGSKTFDEIASAKLWYINFPKEHFPETLDEAPFVCEIKSGNVSTRKHMANALNISSMALLILAIIY